MSDQPYTPTGGTTPGTPVGASAGMPVGTSSGSSTAGTPWDTAGASVPTSVPDRQRSIGELLGDVSQDLSRLMRQEVDLAKAEVKQSSTRVGKGIGMFVGAALAGLLLLVFVSVSAWWGLGQFIGNQWSALIVALIWAIVAVVLVLAGRSELQRVRGLDRTTETLSKIPNAVRGQEEANR